jgi:hypothetical protein
MIISVEVDAPTRSDRRVSWIVGGVVAAIFAGLVVGALANDNSTPKPTPTRERVVEVLSADQQTALLYSSWLGSAAFSACMKSRGFAREAVAGNEHSRVDTVAAYLGILPQQPQTWLSPAEARNGHPASARTRANDLDLALQDTKDGGCQGQGDAVDVHDAIAVTAAVDAAHGDPAFYRYLAETAWLADNPAEALLYQTHLMMAGADPTAPLTSDRWLPQLERMTTFIDSVEGWTEGPTEGYADFAQAVAIAADGSMVVIRVGDPAVIETGFVSNIARPMIDCGDVGVILGTGEFSEGDNDPSEPYSALTSGACDAVD